MIDLRSLIDNIDIVLYISQFVDLELRSDGQYWGCSPFTNEVTPSFSVNDQLQSFYCFSSGIGGNVFTFVKHYYRCGAKEAIAKLTEFVGNDGEISYVRSLESTRILNRFSIRASRKSKSSNTILPDRCMDKYIYRDDKLSVWEEEDISRDVLNKFCVKYDPVTNRIVYPIKDISGNIVNIGARTLDPLWKEKHLRKYSYCQGWGGQMDVVYGLFENQDNIIDKHCIILFEGCKSVLKSCTWGIKNSGAILTSHLSDAQLKLLIKFCVSNNVSVVFALDRDVDPREDHNIQKLKKFVNVFYIFDFTGALDDKDAPVDKGKEVFLNLYEHKRRIR